MLTSSTATSSVVSSALATASSRRASGPMNLPAEVLQHGLELHRDQKLVLDHEDAQAA
jgi:hypothetical protein